MALGQYDATLQNVSTRYPMPNSQVAFILVGFIEYLREQGLNVNTHLTGLLWHFETNARDPSAFQFKLVRQARMNTIVSRIPNNARLTATEKLNRETQPLPVDMLLNARTRYFPDNANLGTPAEFDNAATYLAACLMLDVGVRVSNLLRSRSRSTARRGAHLLHEVSLLGTSPPHVDTSDPAPSLEQLTDQLQLAGVIRAEDVLFSVKDASDHGSATHYKAQDWSRRAQTNPAHVDRQPDEISLLILVSKTSINGNRPVRTSRSADDSQANRLLCVMAGRIADAAHYASPNDPFFSRRSLRNTTLQGPDQAGAKRCCIQSKDINKLVKEIATSQGLHAAGFTAKSLKYSHVTSNQMAGLSRQQSALVTGHASQISHDHYLAGLVSRQVGTLTAAQVPGTAAAIISTTDAIANQSRFRTVPSRPSTRTTTVPPATASLVQATSSISPSSETHTKGISTRRRRRDAEQDPPPHASRRVTRGRAQSTQTSTPTGHGLGDRSM